MKTTWEKHPNGDWQPIFNKDGKEYAGSPYKTYIPEDKESNKKEAIMYSMDRISDEARKMLEAEIAEAKIIATEVHKGVFRKLGKKEPYINHPRRVAEDVDLYYRAVAWLHDTVEDAKNKEEVLELIENKFRPDQVKSILILSRDDGESYFDFIIRIADSEDEAAMAVKIADLEDNMFDLKEGSMKDKYRFAKNMLESVI